MDQICSCCGDRLKNSDHYEVISRDARNHDLEMRVDEIQHKKKDEEIEGANEEEIEEEREKHLESIRKSLRKLTSQELDDELFKLQSELHDIKKKLNPEEETKEETQERDSRLEHIGVDSSVITNTRYHVMTLDQSYRDSKSGDKLLQSLGSTDSDSVSDTSGDELLRKLGSTD